MPLCRVGRSAPGGRACGCDDEPDEGLSRPGEFGGFGLCQPASARLAR